MIYYHVPAYFEKMAVFLNEDRFVSALEQLACPLMTFIEKLRIDAVQLPHPRGKIAVRRLDQKVIVIVHHTVGMTEPVISFIDMLECVQEVDPVLVVLENGLLFIAAGGEVINGAGVFNAEGAGHAVMVSEKRWNVKIKDPIGFRCQVFYFDVLRFRIVRCTAWLSTVIAGLVYRFSPRLYVGETMILGFEKS